MRIYRCLLRFLYLFNLKDLHGRLGDGFMHGDRFPANVICFCVFYGPAREIADELVLFISLNYYPLKLFYVQRFTVVAKEIALLP